MIYDGDYLLLTCKSDISNEIKWEFFLGVAVSVLFYGCTTWILKKCQEKRLRDNYNRILRIVLNK